jgi:Protein of unknown function (DUF3307)
VGIPWVELFAVFVVSHLAGDFILQTEFQATNKHGALTGTARQRWALGSHALTYTACFTPALVWIALDADVSALGLVATVLAVVVPHALQDDGRAMRWWMRTVKHTQVAPGVLAIMVDQSFHMVALLLLAIVVGG